jgi:hypothetical protein
MIEQNYSDYNPNTRVLGLFSFLLVRRWIWERLAAITAGVLENASGMDAATTTLQHTAV